MSASNKRSILDRGPQYKAGCHRSALATRSFAHYSLLIKAFELGFLTLLVAIGTSVCFAQAVPAGISRMDAGVFATGGLMNTQLPDYSDNALGRAT